MVPSREPQIAGRCDGGEAEARPMVKAGRLRLSPSTLIGSPAARRCGTHAPSAMPCGRSARLAGPPTSAATARRAMRARSAAASRSCVVMSSAVTSTSLCASASGAGQLLRRGRKDVQQTSMTKAERQPRACERHRRFRPGFALLGLGARPRRARTRNSRCRTRRSPRSCRSRPCGRGRPARSS